MHVNAESWKIVYIYIVRGWSPTRVPCKARCPSRTAHQLDCLVWSFGGWWPHDSITASAAPAAPHWRFQTAVPVLRRKFFRSFWNELLKGLAASASTKRFCRRPERVVANSLRRGALLLPQNAQGAGATKRTKTGRRKPP